MNPLLEQESLTLVFVALGLGIIGMAFGRIKTKDSLHLHRWTMTGAIALNNLDIYCNVPFTVHLLHRPNHERPLTLFDTADNPRHSRIPRNRHGSDFCLQ
jgi:hypothetical protein